MMIERKTKLTEADNKKLKGIASELGLDLSSLIRMYVKICIREDEKKYLNNEDTK